VEWLQCHVIIIYIWLHFHREIESFHNSHTKIIKFKQKLSFTWIQQKSWVNRYTDVFGESHDVDYGKISTGIDHQKKI